jgi:hypothetical protein
VAQLPLIKDLPQLLGTEPSNATWVITSTLLSGAVATPIMRTVADRGYDVDKHVVCCANAASPRRSRAAGSSTAPGWTLICHRRLVRAVARGRAGLERRPLV